MKLTIITINYNNAVGLRETIESVVSQTFKDLEYLVIDGGSTDGATEIIKKYQNRIDYWVSEPDNGVYHAMNKGIKAANGYYLLMLNSGDMLKDNQVLEKVVPLLASGEDIIYGDIIWRDHEHNPNLRTVFPNELSFGYFLKDTLGHQATFIKKAVHDNLGLYDETLKISADWAFLMIAICKFNCSYKHIALKVSVCDREGISCNPENKNLIIDEKNRILKREFPLIIKDFEHYEQRIKILQRSWTHRLRKLFHKNIIN